MRVVGWYVVAYWHRAPGCEVEETGHHTAARLERVTNAVIAWRALSARKTPTGPAELLFSDLELLVVYATKLPRMPKAKTLKEAAAAAGYRNRKHAARPKSGRVIPVSHCQAYENLAEIKKRSPAQSSPSFVMTGQG